MNKPNEQIQHLIHSLEERTKELNCLYETEEILHNSDADVRKALDRVLAVLPGGMQYPEAFRARIVVADVVSAMEGFPANAATYRVDITVQEEIVGSLTYCYNKTLPPADEGAFLRSEIRLLHAIADLIGHYFLHQRLQRMSQMVATAKENIEAFTGGGWRIVVNLINRTDPDLFLRISRKMNNYLCWKGVREAEAILQRFGIDRRSNISADAGENRPMQAYRVDQIALGEEIFDIAARSLSEDEILKMVQRWILEDKSQILVRTLVSRDLMHAEVGEAIRRLSQLTASGSDLSESTRKSIRVALVDRFLSNQLEFIKVAKQYVDINDFYELVQQMISPGGSRGALGGKGAGLFLAYSIIRRISDHYPELKGIRVPKTWYLTADGMDNFLRFNSIEEVTEQKYKPIEQVRLEYPNIAYSFKNSHFPPEMIQGFRLALEDIGDSPLIVRSSSLLEDRFGAAFSGKYISLFLANQGSMEARLEALMDAIAEVFASVYHSDPIEYRTERGLLDFNEGMGVLIQEVVGTKVGRYYLPSFAGVAFSNNEFRWSPRINREDGLVRMVVGLGTRAVDRLSDDYTILAAPGRPNLQVNTTPDDKMRYSPRRLDLINLETNSFETVNLKDFLRENGASLPGVWNVVSSVSEGVIRPGSQFETKLEQDNLLVTFDGLFTKTNFLKDVKLLLDQLRERLGAPVDIEFASDGVNFYLLQCRPQGHADDQIPAPIPLDLTPEQTLFTANRYISNGLAPDITHIVYVPPQRYSALGSLEEMLETGRAVGKLNALLPRRSFILIGPGRWGSRGDVKLGVSVTYSDINNSAMLVEVGRKKGNYTPDLSFGTHFFQDLVEAQIRYLPLYPDNPEIIFNEEFLLDAENQLPRLLPEYAHLKETLIVVDVAQATGGKILKVLMNAEMEKAVGYFK